ncbi:response regulator [Dactylosporangium sp. NPDC049140]|uniref:response regulator n=1 Tax=Dactylosporangium sp. NPDC049140 TaxID=3155647 RepID=UPI0033FBCE6F
MDIRDLVAFKLEQAGYEVVAVDNGLAALTENPPDLVVLDVMMPGMSGIDVCRQLRQEQGTKALPIILLTARAQEGDVEVGFGAGADDYREGAAEEAREQLRPLLGADADAVVADLGADPERLLSMRILHNEQPGEHRTGALALMLDREIAARHGGAMVTSAGRPGVTVRIALPARCNPARDAAQAGRTDRSGAAQRTDSYAESMRSSTSCQSGAVSATPTQPRCPT